MQGDRDVMHKCIATLEELNKSPPQVRRAPEEGCELQQQVATRLVFLICEGYSDDDTTKAPSRTSRTSPWKNIPSLKRETLASPSSEAMQQTVRLAETEVALQEARQEHELYAGPPVGGR